MQLIWCARELTCPAEHSQAAAIQATLEQDLDLTSQCLRRNPKEYAVWEHRKWVLKTMPDPDWRLELKTVEALLERDARNCESRPPAQSLHFPF